MTADALVERVFRRRYADDPVGFARDVIGVDLWSKQREILEAVRDHHRVAVRSGHGVGKTAAAAVAVLWFHDSFPNSRVISTAPTFEPGVKDLLWRDIREFHARANGRINSKAFDTRLERNGRSKRWFAAGYSTDKPERFSGHHAEHLLLVVDEGSGVDEEIYEAAEGFLTSEHARVLLIGNPTQPSGQFFRAFHSERAEWKTIHVSCLDSPNLTGEPVSDAAARGLVGRRWVEQRRRMWGEDSIAYQVRVLGDFASRVDDTVCPLGLVEAAQQRELEPAGEPRVVSCDVARFGSDETVIAVREGNRVRIARSYVGQDTMRTVGAILEVARGVSAHATPEYPRAFTRLVIDDTGVGGGVTDRLRELGEFPVIGFQAGEQSWSGDYPNRRSEAWFSFGDRLPVLDLDEDEQLAADLVAPRYTLDSNGRRVVEPKAATKKRLGRSPDRADAVLLAFSLPDRIDIDAYRPQPGPRDELWRHAEGLPADATSLTADLLTRPW